MIAAHHHPVAAWAWLVASRKVSRAWRLEAFGVVQVVSSSRGAALAPKVAGNDRARRCIALPRAQGRRDRLSSPSIVPFPNECVQVSADDL